MKKSIKKVKKNLEIRKSRRIFVAVIKQQTHRKGKSLTIKNINNYEGLYSYAHSRNRAR